MEKEIRIVGFTGSLRKGSYNMAVLRAAKELLPEGVILEILDLSKLPFYNEDLDLEGPVPEVEVFKNRLRFADAILIATPEYNYSIPPVLKNALDWASRDKKNPLAGKSLGIVSASQGSLGGARAQYHLRQVCVRLDLYPLNKPEVFIAKAHEKFNDEGILTDENTRSILIELLDDLVSSIHKK